MIFLRNSGDNYSSGAIRSDSPAPRRREDRKRILVAGGAGFLGSHPCERLLGAGHQVICLDNFSTGLRRNIRQLKRSDAFSVIAHDIIEPIDLEVDEIYNLACPASPPTVNLSAGLTRTIRYFDGHLTRTDRALKEVA